MVGSNAGAQKDGMAGGDSGPLNSSNSNIEEEFEQIKAQLQQLSNMNLAAIKNKKQGITADDGSVNLDKTNEGQKNGKKAKLPPIDHVKIK